MPHINSACRAQQDKSDSPFPAHLPFRLTLRRSRHHAPDYFTFEITTADAEISAIGDKWDAFFDLRFKTGTPRERVIRACLLMLTDPNRLSRKGNHRLTTKPDWWERHDMTDAELWRLAMRVIEPEVSQQRVHCDA